MGARKCFQSRTFKQIDISKAGNEHIYFLQPFIVRMSQLIHSTLNFISSQKEEWSLSRGQLINNDNNDQSPAATMFCNPVIKNKLKNSKLSSSHRKSIGQLVDPDRETRDGGGTDKG